MLDSPINVFENFYNYFINPEQVVTWDSKYDETKWGAYFSSEKDYNNSILSEINYASAIINRKTYDNLSINPFINYGGGEIIISSPNIFYKYISDLEYFSFLIEEGHSLKNLRLNELGYIKTGILSSKYEFYIHDDFPDDKIYVVNPNHPHMSSQLNII